MKSFKKISILMIATTTKRMTTKRIRKIYSHLKERRTTSEEFFQLERTQSHLRTVLSFFQDLVNCSRFFPKSSFPPKICCKQCLSGTLIASLMRCL